MNKYLRRSGEIEIPEKKYQRARNQIARTFLIPASVEAGFFASPLAPILNGQFKLCQCVGLCA